jgi:ribosome-associated heat shock protein Hsp15
MTDADSMRIDKWLWAVRLYKSRSIAAAACGAGRVVIGGQKVKPSRIVRVGDVITAVTGDINRTVKVLGMLEGRVGAKLVPNYMEDLTPAAEFQKPREPHYRTVGLRPKGAGRPTKKERRQWDAADPANS